MKAQSGCSPVSSLGADGLVTPQLGPAEGIHESYHP